MAQIQTLSAALQKVAIEELGEVPSRIPEDLQVLKSWIQQQAHLAPRTDDQFLIQFLRGCKYSLERAKEKLVYFYALRTKYPESFGAYNVDDLKTRELVRSGCFIKLPVLLNDNGSRILLFRFIYDVRKFTAEDVVRTAILLIEMQIMSDPYSCIQGITVMFDLAHITFNHYLQAKALLIKNLSLFTEKALPLRIKAIYIVNTSKTAKNIVELVLAVFSKKTLKKVHICVTSSDLAKHMSRKYIPRELGGENGVLDKENQDLLLEMDSHREYFKENVKYKTDEKLRLGTDINFDEIFGIGGSFRKIEVD